MEQVGTVAEVWRYPVKSMQGERVERLEVGPGGATGDRVLAVVDPAAGKVLSAKRYAPLLEASARTEARRRRRHPARRHASTPPRTRASTPRCPPGSTTRCASRRPPADARAPDGDVLRACPTRTPRCIDWPGPPGTWLDLADAHWLTTASLAAAAELHPDGAVGRAPLPPHRPVRRGRPGLRRGRLGRGRGRHRPVRGADADDALLDAARGPSRASVRDMAIGTDAPRPARQQPRASTPRSSSAGAIAVGDDVRAEQYRRPRLDRVGQHARKACGSMANDAPLRIAYLTYRGKPHVGGQGVYTRHLTKALVDLGHHVEVLGGQPYPILDERVPLVELPEPRHLQRPLPDAAARDLGAEELEGRRSRSAAFTAGTFPEPLAFSMRAWDHLRHRKGEFDIVQDNQCLGYGLLLIERQLGIPVLGTIHHPITDGPPPRDRRTPRAGTRSSPCAAGTPSSTCRPRWPAGSSGSSRCRRTPSRTSSPTTRSTPTAWPSCPWASTPSCSGPLPDVAAGPRPPRHHRLGRRGHEGPEVPARGRGQAPHRARRRPPGGHRPPQAGRRQRRGHQDSSASRTTSSSSRACHEERIIELYSEAELAVVPSLYEGFSLPAIEAMSCGVPLVATTGGAIPEVVGTDGDTALLVPPGDSEALAAKLALGPRAGRPAATPSAPAAASASSTAGRGCTPP